METFVSQKVVFPVLSCLSLCSLPSAPPSPTCLLSHLLHSLPLPLTPQLQPAWGGVGCFEDLAFSLSLNLGVCRLGKGRQALDVPFPTNSLNEKHRTKWARDGVSVVSSAPASGSLWRPWGWHPDSLALVLSQMWPRGSPTLAGLSMKTLFFFQALSAQIGNLPSPPSLLCSGFWIPGSPRFFLPKSHV